MDKLFSKPLAEASVQELQLELIRRSEFNAFDGERIVVSLLAKRHLWEAVLLDRIGILRGGRLPAMGLIKLRDLSGNLWNADTIYVLTPDAKSARELGCLIEAEDWGGMLRVCTEQEEVDEALGSGREKRAIVSIWWD